MKHINYLTKTLPILALVYACHTEPISKPIREDVVRDVIKMDVASLLEPGYSVAFHDFGLDGKVDGLLYADNGEYAHRGGRNTHVMAYDSSYYKYYNKFLGGGVIHAIKLTPALDSAMSNFIKAAKEFKWKYELEKYKQQKSF